MKIYRAMPPLLKTIRLHIVMGGLLAFSIGALLGIANGGILDPVTIALCYAIVLFGDLSTHYGNDYFDVEYDKFAERKKFFSGKNIMVNHPELRPLARTISMALVMLSIFFAVLVVIFQMASPLLLIVVLTANFLGWFYSAPPIRLVSKGFGEVAIAIAVGFAIPAVGYLAVKGQLDDLMLYFSLPFVLYGFMVAFSLQAPDIEADRKVGKLNVGARKGRQAVFALILAAAVAALALFIVYAWQLTFPTNLWTVAVFSSVPFAAAVVGAFAVFQDKNGDRYSAANIFSLFAFSVFMVTYLAVIIICS